MVDREELIRIFSQHLREMLRNADLDFEKLQEIRLRAGKPLVLRYEGEERFLSGRGEILTEAAGAWLVTPRELRETMEFVGKYSLYAYEEELRQGFLTLPGGHRVGIAGKTFLEGDRVRGIRPVSCINLRISHQITGCADVVLPYLRDGMGVHNSLLISPPRCGKTTLLRDLVRQISNGTDTVRGHTVGVVDERSEICGCCQGVPSLDVGIRTDVLDGCPKAEGMMLLIRSMAPEVLAVDEVGGERDIEALETALFCGCRILATVHGNSLEDIRSKPLFERLLRERIFERFVILGNGERTGMVRRILDGRGQRLC